MTFRALRKILQNGAGAVRPEKLSCMSYNLTLGMLKTNLWNGPTQPASQRTVSKDLPRG